MAVFGINEIKDINMSPITARDITVGSQYYVPSGVGGVYRAECIDISGDVALLRSLNEHWDGEIELNLNPEPLTFDDCKVLSTALKNFTSFTDVPKETLDIIIKGRLAGHISVLSYTQVQWTEAGIAHFNSLKQAA